MLENELESIKTDTTLGTKVFDLRFEGGVEGSLESALRLLCLEVESAV